METSISENELSRHLLDILNRVKNRGERFVVERNGETIAMIAPVNEKTGTTWEEFRERFADTALPGEGFADDLEAVQAGQGLAEMPDAKVPGLVAYQPDW